MVQSPPAAPAAPPDPRGARVHALRLRLDLLRWSAQRAEERAAQKRAILAPLVKTAADRVRFERVRYSATARIKALRAQAAGVLAEIEALELELSL